MNKLLTKIVGVVLGTSMAVGVGTAVIAKNTQGINSEVNAASGDTYTFTGTSGTSTDTFWSFSAAKSSGSSNPAYTSSQLRLYCKNTITFTGGSGVKLNSASFTCAVNASSGTKPTGYSVDNGTLSSYSNTQTSFTWTGASGGHDSFTITVNGTKGNLALKTVVMNFTATATAQTITVSADVVYSDQTISLSTNADSANWSFTKNTAGASLSVASGKSTVVSATQAGQVIVQASASGYTTVTKTLVFRIRPTGTNVTAVFGETDATTSVDFSNTAFTIPSILTLDNDQGYVYGNNTNQASAIKFGKSGEVGSFDVTIDSGYYITSVICNLKYYDTDTTATFSVTPEGGSAINTSLTDVFTDYYFDVSSGEPGKLTFASDVAGKRVYLSEFVLSYEERSAAVVPATGVVVSPDEETIFVGDTLQLTATVSPSGATDKTVTWESDDNSIATVDTDGLVTAVAAGETYITVTANGGTDVQDIASITVSDLLTPTLVVSSGTGSTSFKFGDDLDTTGWSATYTNERGVASDVLNNLDFGSLNYIGTKALTATYGGATSNGINITVTNNGTSSGYVTLLNGDFSSGKSSIVSPWSQSGVGSDYAAGNAPYLTKFDTTGDTLTASVDTSAAKIKVSMTLKMLGGGNSSSFAITAKDADENTVATGSLSIEGSQNDVLEIYDELENNGKTTIKTIELVFTKGSNIGVSNVSISINDTDTFANNQALAWARYFLDQTDGYCNATISSSVKTSLVNEFNWMISEAKAVFKAADIVRGKGVTYDDDLSEALSRYVNMLEEKGYSDSEFLNLGDDVVKKASAQNYNVLGNAYSNVSIIVIISLIGLTSIGGYFLLRKRKEER